MRRAKTRSKIITCTRICYRNKFITEKKSVTNLLQKKREEYKISTGKKLPFSRGYFLNTGLEKTNIWLCYRYSVRGLEMVDFVFNIAV